MINTPYDHIADQFSATRTHLAPNEFKYLSLLLENLSPGSAVLDLGCGTGNPVASHLISCGHHIVGVDGSQAVLEYARRQFPEQRWIHALMEQVQFDETFDAIICWDSLFHLPRRNYEIIIRKVHHWLQPGGWFMVSSGGVVDETQDGFTDTMFGQEFYYDSLPPEKMVNLIEQTGFNIILAEMCDLPDGSRNKGKWATIAIKRP